MEFMKNFLVFGCGFSCVVEVVDDVGDKVFYSDEVFCIEVKWYGVWLNNGV